MNRFVFAFLSVVYTCTISSVASESVYIITSQENHCSWEFTPEEACLTLQQYVYDPSLTSNVSLRMEAGYHTLQGTGMYFNFDKVPEDSDRDEGNTLTITAESASIIYSNALSLYSASTVNYYSLILTVRNAGYVSLSGVTFMSSNVGYVKIENVYDLIIEYCTFNGVQLYLYTVNNAEISKTSFFNYSHENDIYNFDHEFGALFISQSTVKIDKSNFTSNQHAITYYDRGHDVDGSITFPSQSYSLQITDSTFTNNTSEYGGSAINIVGSPSLSIQHSVFIFNTASGSGGAVHFDRCNETTFSSITSSTFIYNSASFCGTFSIYNFYGSVEISDSNFYYNSAVHEGDGVGGVGCIRNASISIYNSKFIANEAIGDAGALHLDESTVTISNAYFSNNTARRDGGALFTYTHLSDYFISGSTFMHNVAGDDGGAVFVGRKGSQLRTKNSVFISNNATDRGGAICVIGSTLNIAQTNIYGNSANTGKQISACNSFVLAFIPGRKDPNFPYCSLYDTDIVSTHYSPPVTFIYGNVTWLNHTVDGIVKTYAVIGNKTSRNTTNSSGMNKLTSGDHLLHQTSIIAYTALAVAATLTILLLVYICASKVLVRCKIKPKKSGRYYRLSAQAEEDDDDDEELLQDHHK